MQVDLKKVKSFKSAAAWHKWLEKNHDSENVLWMKIYKKSSGIRSIDWGEAVIEALAWGWIDGLKKSNDDESYYQRFTPRKPKSGWSKVNCNHVERLIREQRMQKPGMEHVESARTDGRWDKAYSSSNHFEVPKDFLAALKRPGNAKARKFYKTLNRRNQYAIYYRLTEAKRPETRRKRIQQFLEMMNRGEKWV